MLKKAITGMAIAVAATGASVAGAAPALASDSVGGDYSQNVNLLPHLCADVDDVLDLIDVKLLNDTDAIQCDEISTGGVKYSEDKAPLSDLIDAGAANH